MSRKNHNYDELNPYISDDDNDQQHQNIFTKETNNTLIIKRRRKYKGIQNSFRNNCKTFYYSITSLVVIAIFSIFLSRKTLILSYDDATTTSMNPLNVVNVTTIPSKYQHENLILNSSDDTPTEITIMANKSIDNTNDHANATLDETEAILTIVNASNGNILLNTTTTDIASDQSLDNPTNMTLDKTEATAIFNASDENIVVNTTTTEIETKVNISVGTIVSDQSLLDNNTSDYTNITLDKIEATSMDNPSNGNIKVNGTTTESNNTGEIVVKIPDMPKAIDRPLVPEHLHIVIWGDSILRFQYVNLVFYLHYGRWFDRDEPPNLALPYTMGNWAQFYAKTNKMLDGKELCDCYRGDLYVPSENTENRYYSDPSKDNYVAYIQKLGSYQPSHGHWDPSINMFTSRNDTNYNTSMEWVMKVTNMTMQVYEDTLQPSLWEYDWVDTIRHHIRYLYPLPSHILLNAGLWENNFNNITLLEEIQHECHYWNISTIYLTTTANRLQQDPIEFASLYKYEKDACRIFDSCIDRSWTLGLKGERYYTDPSHFRSNVNRLFSEQLFDHLHYNDHLQLVASIKSSTNTSNNVIIPDTPREVDRPNIPEHIRIVFIGDSISRYQYLSLVHYLHTGQWYDRIAVPNIAQEATFSSWLQFYDMTNKMLDGKELCDCYRVEPYVPSEVTENRYYSDPVKDNYIAYIQKLGGSNYLAHGHWDPSINMYISQNDNEDYNNTERIMNAANMSLQVYEDTLRPPIWEYEWVDVIRHHIQYLHPRPNYIILNAGLWKNDFHNITIMEEIQRECQYWNISTIYKTTTAARLEQDPIEFDKLYTYEKDACRIFDSCINLSWTVGLKGDHYYSDQLHFKANVNRLFNEQLFDHLHNISTKII